MDDLRGFASVTRWIENVNRYYNLPESEWELVYLGGRVGITCRLPRATSFIRTPIAVRGTIVRGGVIPVPSPGPILEE